MKTASWPSPVVERPGEACPGREHRSQADGSRGSIRARRRSLPPPCRSTPTRRSIRRHPSPAEARRCLCLRLASECCHIRAHRLPVLGEFPEQVRNFRLVVHVDEPHGSQSREGFRNRARRTRQHRCRRPDPDPPGRVEQQQYGEFDADATTDPLPNRTWAHQRRNIRVDEQTRARQPQMSPQVQPAPPCLSQAVPRVRSDSVGHSHTGHIPLRLLRPLSKLAGQAVGCDQRGRFELKAESRSVGQHDGYVATSACLDLCSSHKTE